MWLTSITHQQIWHPAKTLDNMFIAEKPHIYLIFRQEMFYTSKRIILIVDKKIKVLSFHDAMYNFLYVFMCISNIRVGK